jgi:Tfp pilus assembly protein PilF
MLLVYHRLGIGFGTSARASVNERESKLLKMATQFAEAPTAQFSLGKFYLDEGRWEESTARSSVAVKLDPTFAAAWVALGDAHSGGGQPSLADEAWDKAKSLALEQGHPELAEEIDRRRE